MDKEQVNDYLGNLNQEIYRKKQEINHEHDFVKRLEALIVEAQKERKDHQEQYQNLGVILGMTASEYDKSLKMKESMENEYTELMCELDELTETIDKKTRLKKKMDTHYTRMETRFDDMTKHNIERRNELLNSLQRDRPADQIKLFKPIVPVRSRIQSTATASATTSDTDTTRSTDTTAQEQQETAQLALQELKQLGLFNFNYGRGIEHEEVPEPELTKNNDKENSAQDIAMEYFENEENQIKNSLANPSKLIEDNANADTMKISMAETQKTSDVDFFATVPVPAEVNLKKIPLSIQDTNRMEYALENTSTSTSGLLENKQSSSSSVFEDSNKENSTLQTQIVHQQQQQQQSSTASIQQQKQSSTASIQQQQQQSEEIVSDVEDFKIPNDPAEAGKYEAGFFNEGGFNFFNNSLDTQSSAGDSDLDFLKWPGASTSSTSSDTDTTSMYFGNSNFTFF